MLKYFVLLGVLFMLGFTFPYIKDVVKGKVQPNKVTWLMWSIAPLIASAAAWANGVTWAVIPVFMAGFAPLLVFLSSFVNKKAYWKTTGFDVCCGILSLAALVIWYLTDNPTYAIVFSLLSDGTAALPTLIKSQKHPETENMFPYLGSILSSSTTFFAIAQWNFSTLAFPIYLILLNLLFVYFLRPRKTKKDL